MPRLIPSKKFLEDLETFRSQKELIEKIAKALTYLETNPHHPGLHLERIVNDPSAWSIRVDRRYRISFDPETTMSSGLPDWSGSLLLLRVLAHDAPGRRRSARHGRLKEEVQEMRCVPLTASALASSESAYGKGKTLAVPTLCMYVLSMQIDRDEDKRLSNLAKHGVDFADAPEMFACLMLIGADTRKEYQRTNVSRSVMKRKSETDWNRIDSRKDEDIDLSDIPEWVTSFSRTLR